MIAERSDASQQAFFCCAERRFLMHKFRNSTQLVLTSSPGFPQTTAPVGQAVGGHAARSVRAHDRQWGELTGGTGAGYMSDCGALRSCAAAPRALKAVPMTHAERPGSRFSDLQTGTHLDALVQAIAPPAWPWASARCSLVVVAGGRRRPAPGPSPRRRWFFGSCGSACLMRWDGPSRFFFHSFAMASPSLWMPDYASRLRDTYASEDRAGGERRAHRDRPSRRMAW